MQLFQTSDTSPELISIVQLRVTIGIGHLRATMGHLRLTIGHLKATVVHIRVSLGHLRVTIGYFFYKQI